MLGAAWFIWRQARMPRRRTRRLAPRCAPPSTLGRRGLTVGVLTGLFGVGGGFLVVPMLALAMRFPLRRAIGTSLAIVAFVSFVALRRPSGSGGRVRHRADRRDGCGRGSRRLRGQPAERAPADRRARSRIRRTGGRGRRLRSDRRGAGLTSPAPSTVSATRRETSIATYVSPTSCWIITSERVNDFTGTTSLRPVLVRFVKLRNRSSVHDRSPVGSRAAVKLAGSIA